MFSSKTQSEPNESVSIGKTKMKVGGGEIEVDFNTINFKTQYFDEYTGEPLPYHLVRAAMIEEMLYFSEKAVWTAADWADMKSSKAATCVRMRWVLCNKGDLNEPDMRARLVACAVAKNKVAALYASTPPLECNKGAALKVRRTANPGWSADGVDLH